MNAHVTGYAQDLMYALGTLRHIEEQAQAGLLGNVTLDTVQFVAVGFDGNAYFPVLARNTVTGDWIWARALIWCEAREDKPAGFVWSNGHYTDEKDARENFEEQIRAGGLVWYEPREY